MKLSTAAPLLVCLLTVAVAASAFPTTENEAPLSGSRFAEPSYNFGYHIPSIAVADMDGDGNPDIVALDSTYADMFITKVTADGKFSQFGNGVDTASDPRAITVGDVNGDGLSDIVVANGTPGTVSVFICDSIDPNDPTHFAPRVDYKVGTTPVAVKLADLNDDGFPDIVTADSGSAAVSVLINNGDGTFKAATNFTVATDPVSIAIADLNHDGNPDIVTVNSGSNSASVLLSKGGANFRSHVDYPTGTDPVSVGVSKMNADSYPDIVVANQTDGTVSLLTGVGDGTFNPKSDFTTAANPILLALVNLNGNGKFSVVTASNDGTVSVLENPGDGTLKPPVNYASGDPATALTTGDLNGDGRDDIILASTGGVSENGDKLAILYANDDGTLQADTGTSLGDIAVGIASGDFNDDKKLDIVVGVLGVAEVWLGAGDGTFAHKTDLSVPSGIESIAVADVNHDAIDDIIITGGTSEVSVFLGNGDGTFTASSQTPITVGNVPVKVIVTDVNGDKIPDILTANNNDGMVSVLLGNGDGTFGSSQEFTTGGFLSDMAVADVNGDGKPDLLTANYASNTFSVLIGNGDGTFQTHKDYAADDLTYGIAVGDLNGDGKPDVVVSNSGSNVFGIYLGNGDGTFQDPYYFDVNNGAGPQAVTLADVNSDGNLDIISNVDDSDFVTVLYGKGDGTFTSESDHATGALPGAFTLGDFNGDGLTDIAVAEWTGEEFRLIPGVSAPPVTTSEELTDLKETPLSGKLPAELVTTGESSTFSIVTNPTHGILNIDSDGGFTYTPDQGFTGTDSFSFVAATGNMKSRETPEKINVTTPTTSSDSFTVTAGKSYKGTLSGGPSGYSGVADFSIVSKPEHGDLTLTDAETGKFTYTPASGYTGTDSFSFKYGNSYVTSSVATENITVTAASSANNGVNGSGGGGGGALSIVSGLLLLGFAGLRHRRR